MLKFFAEKMWVAFAKATHIFQQKISEYCILNPLKQLTKWPLTSSLTNDALNNWALTTERHCMYMSILYFWQVHRSEQFNIAVH